MWHGCLSIDKECRLEGVHGSEPQNRMQVHDWLVNQSNSNPWIKKDLLQDVTLDKLRIKRN